MQPTSDNAKDIHSYVAINLQLHFHPLKSIIIVSFILNHSLNEKCIQLTKNAHRQYNHCYVKYFVHFVNNYVSTLKINHKINRRAVTRYHTIK